jgi:hypothetical protein
MISIDAARPAKPPMANRKSTIAATHSRGYSDTPFGRLPAAFNRLSRLGRRSRWIFS